MSTKERIEELQEKRQEFILNESVFEDDHPSWGEVAEAGAIAESKWDETDDGRELKALERIERLIKAGDGLYGLLVEGLTDTQNEAWNEEIGEFLEALEEVKGD